MKFNQCSIAGPKGENQDAILSPFQIRECIWCGIADGVGSSAFGGLAAQSSLEVIQHVSGDETMRDVFNKVNTKLTEIWEKLPPGKSISTTLSVLKICGERAFIGHVGDTRILHYRGAGVVGRSKDQTEVQKLLDDGVLTKNQARRYPRRNVLLSAMSGGRDFELFEANFAVARGDRILLTTDGFHEKILRGEIAEISAQYSSFDDFWNAILGKISSVTLSDDASCLALEIG